MDGDFQFRFGGGSFSWSVCIRRSVCGLSEERGINGERDFVGTRMSAFNFTSSSDDTPVTEDSLLRTARALWRWSAATAADEKQKHLEEALQAPVASHFLRWAADEKYPGLLDHVPSKTLEAGAAHLSAEVKRLSDERAAAENTEGDTEIRETWVKQAEVAHAAGDKAAALSAYQHAYDLSASGGQRIDLVFGEIRLGWAMDDQTLVEQQLEKAKELLSGEADWERKNRMKVYEALEKMRHRDFVAATDLLLECLATFSATELCSYEKLVEYACWSALLTLERKKLRAKIVESPEVLTIALGNDRLQSYITSFYECKYATLFVELAHVSDEFQMDLFLSPSRSYYTRRMRIRAYAQFLHPFRSVTLQSAAEHFGVTKEWIEAELARWIAAGHLHCKLDTVSGVIETVQPDERNALYKDTIKKGDLLLNRVQKLTRLLDV